MFQRMIRNLLTSTLIVAVLLATGLTVPAACAAPKHGNPPAATAHHGQSDVKTKHDKHPKKHKKHSKKHTKKHHKAGKKAGHKHHTPSKRG
jgi:hypothetical protein